MRRDAEHRTGHARHGTAAGVQQLRKAIEIVDETPLAFVRRLPAETGMGIEHREKRQADAGRFGGGGDAFGQFGDVVIGRAGKIVVDIVKFADPREARLQHLDIGLRSHRLDIVRRHAADETVHHLAPGPEAVGRGAADFGEARHAALEGVAVQIGHAGKADRVALVAGLQCRLCLDGLQPSSRHRQPHVARPAVRQQRLIEKEGGHRHLR